MAERNAHLAASSRISLDQWRTLVAIVEAGGYAQAAEILHKSQSSVTYAIQKVEALLDVEVFRIEGRKAVLTQTGRMLYRRARLLLEDADTLERLSRKSSAGWEADLAIAVEVLFPTWLLLRCLNRLGEDSPQTRVELYETVIGGAPQALQQGLVDLAITPHIPPGFNGEPIALARMIPVAHPDHPLHQLDRELTMRDLRRHRHLVVRDSGSQRTTRSAFVDVEQRWTVSNMATSIGAASRGYGFAWFPIDKIRTELDEGTLKVLPLRGGRERAVQMYLIHADSDATGPAGMRLADIIREEVRAFSAD